MICRYDMKWYVDMIWNDMVDMIEGKGLVNIEPKSLYMKVWLLFYLAIDKNRFNVFKRLTKSFVIQINSGIFSYNNN